MGGDNNDDERRRQCSCSLFSARRMILVFLFGGIVALRVALDMKNTPKATAHKLQQQQQQQQPIPTIPRNLIFTYKHDILQQKEPQHFYDNILKTIHSYNQIWNENDNNQRISSNNDNASANNTSRLKVLFYTDDDCLWELNATEPKLIPFFQSEKVGAFKADLCRIAALLLHGGYFFDADMEVIQPVVFDNVNIGDNKDTRKEDIVTFATAIEAGKHGFFQSFLASTPNHLVVRNALQIMLQYYQQDKIPRDRVFNLGPHTLKESYNEYYDNNNTNTNANIQGRAVLLNECNLVNSKRFSFQSDELAKRKMCPPSILSLPSLKPLRKGRGCCCNYVVHDKATNTPHFWSRMIGAGRHCDFVSAQKGVKIKVS